MKSRSWIPLTELGRYQKIIRSLPLSVDQKGTFWMTEESDWLVAFVGSPEDSDLSISIYQFRQASSDGAPKNWQRIGVGWKALDEVLLRMDEKNKNLKDLVSKPAPPVVFDSREIIY